MLKQLIIKNLYNFKEELILDFNISENGNLSYKTVSNISLIYGKNNVGKSNLFKIIQAIGHYFERDHLYFDYYRPQGEGLESFFEFTVLLDAEYRFGLSFDAKTSKIHEEYLFKDEVLVYEGHENRKGLEAITEYFKSLIYLHNELDEDLIVDNIKSLDAQHLSILNSLIKASDLDLSIVIWEGDELYFYKEGMTRFRFEDLSSGTKRLLSVGAGFLRSYDKHGLFLIDELDSGLHLELIDLLMTFIKYLIQEEASIQVLASIHREDLLDYNFISDEAKLFLVLDKGSITVTYLSEYIINPMHKASNRYKLNAFDVSPDTSDAYELSLKIHDLSEAHE